MLIAIKFLKAKAIFHEKYESMQYTILIIELLINCYINLRNAYSNFIYKNIPTKKTFFLLQIHLFFRSLRKLVKKVSKISEKTVSFIQQQVLKFFI
jgi:hypothetical protein